MTDPAGNESDPSDSLDFTIDSSKVEITITKVIDDQDPVLGNITSGGVTNDRTPTFVGKANPNATVTITDQNGKVIGTAVANAAGEWTLTPQTALDEGSYQFTATAKNAAGNDASTGFDMTIDLTAPKAPVIDKVIDDVGEKQGEIISGQPTDDQTPTFNGKDGEPGSTIQIKDKDGTVVGETVVDKDGNWTITTRPLGEGDHDLTITATDPAGNESGGTDFTVVVDTQGPSATASLVAISEDRGSDPTDFLTSDNTLVYKINVTGTLESGDTVWMRIVKSDGTSSEWLQATLQSDGSYAVDRNQPQFALADGTYTIETIVRDSAGNASKSNDQQIIIDLKPSSATVTIDGFEDNVGLEQHDYTVSGQKSDDSTPKLHGTLTGAEEGDRIHITAVGPDGKVIDFGYVIAAGNGSWNLQVSENQKFTTEGHYTFTATVEDKGGNAGNSSNFVIDYDVTPPGALTEDTIQLWDDYGPVKDLVIDRGTTTDDTTPTYQDLTEGAVDPKEVAYINVYNTDKDGNTTLLGKGVVNENGSWSFTPKPPLGAGDYIFTAKPVDFAGNEGPATTPWNFTVVTEKPEPPTLDFIYDNVNPDGSTTKVLVQKDGLTNDATPILEGTGSVIGATINIYMVGPDGQKVLVDTTKVDSNQNWSYELKTGLTAQGDYSFTATIVDAAGQESAPTGGYHITLDTVKPVVSGKIIATDDVNVPGNIDGSAPTDDANPTFSGQQPASEAGATVYIYDRNSATPNVPIATATVGADGKWSVDSSKLSDGEHKIYYEVVDLAGNKSDASDDLTFTVDTSGVKVSFSHYEDNVGTPEHINTGGLTNDAKGVLVGDAKPGANVVVTYVNASGQTITVGTAVADSVTGEWRITPTTNLPEGKVDFTIKATDGTGQTDTATASVNVDTVAPDAPKFDVTDDVGDFQSPPLPPLTSGQATDDKTPTFNGKDGEPGSTITIHDENGNVIGTTTVKSDGTWSVTVSELQPGLHDVTVTATDKAGNVSAGTDFTVNVDLTKPDGTASLLSVSDDNGVAGDFVTNDTTLVYKIEANGVQQGDTVWMRITRINSDGKLGTPGEWVQATLQSDGTYQVNRTAAGQELSDGNYQIETVVKDGAGNNGTAGKQTVTIDTQPSSATVTIDGFEDNVGVYTGFVNQSGQKTDDKTPELKGTLTGAEEGDRIHITAVGPDGKVIDFDYVTAGSGGEWSLQVSDKQALSEGDYTFTATVEDKGGNIGDTADFTLTVDTTPPQGVSAELIAISDDTGVAGDFNTSDQTLIYTVKVTGTLQSGDTVWIRITPKDGSAGEWIQATLQSDGTYQVDHNAAATEQVLAAGQYTVETIIRDAAGNSTTSTSKDITIQTGGNIEAVVHINGFEDDQGAFQGFITQSGQTTDDTMPKLSGTVEGLQAGDTIVIRITDANGTRDLGIATIGQDGKTWEYQLTSDQELGEGDYSFKAVVVNNVGVDGSGSNDFGLTVDLTGPVGSATLEAITDDTGSSSTDFVTSDKALVFTINATNVNEAAGETVWMRITPQGGQAGAWVQATLDTATGKYVVDCDDPKSPNYNPLNDGTYTVETIVRDAAGNPNTTTPPATTIVIDTSGPTDGNEVKITVYLDNIDPNMADYGSGTTTNDRAPLLKGTVAGLHAGDVLVVYQDGVALPGYAVVDNNGNWSYQVGDDAANSGLSDGTYTYTVKITDQAGNAGTVSDPFTLTVDTVDPIGTATLSKITDDTGVLADDFITQDGTLKYTIAVNGVEEGDTVWLRVTKQGVTPDANGWVKAVKDTTTGEYIVDNSNGTPLADGSYVVETVVRDAAGNAGPSSSNPLVVVDNSVSDAAVTIDSYADHVGAEQGDAFGFTQHPTTDDRNPTLNGSLNKALQTDEIIVIYNNGVRLGTATVAQASDGSWKWTYDLPDLKHMSDNGFVAKIEDIAGNVGASSNQANLHVELVVNVNELQTTDTTPIVSGSTGFDIRPGEYVEVTINNVTYSSQNGAVVVDPRNNTWYVQIPDSQALAVGTYDVVAVLKNSAGEITRDNTPNELTIDPTPTVNVGSGGANPSEKATGVTYDEHGNWLIFSNQAIMRQNGTDNGSVGSFDVQKVASQVTANSGVYSNTNLVQNGSWMDYNRDGYMDFFGTDSTFNNGQQAFIYNGDGTFTPRTVGYDPRIGSNGTTGEVRANANTDANVYVWFGGVVAFDKTGDGYVDLAYGDQTPYDPQSRGGVSSAFLMNIDGTFSGMLKDWQFTIDQSRNNIPNPLYGQTGQPAEIASNSPASTNWGNAMPDMELSGVDLNNDGTIDIVYHATESYSKIGGAGSTSTAPYNTYRLVVASNNGDGSWNTTQVLADFFQRNEADAMFGNGVSMTWADFNGDGYMDLFIGRGYAVSGHSQYESRIYFNDGTGKLMYNQTAGQATGVGAATGMHWMGDTLQGGASLAVDWNHDGKMDIIELPGLGYQGGMTAQGNVGAINLYTNTSTSSATSFTTTNLLGGNNTIGTVWQGDYITGNVNNDSVTGAVSIDVDYDGAKDLLVFTQKGNTKFIKNENTVAYGTALHFKILDKEGINALYGNTVQLYNSKGELVATQVLNPQSGNQTNDSTAIVDFYGLDPNETYSLALLRNVNGQSADVGGLASLGGNVIENVNSAWTGLKAGEANHAYVLTAESDTANNNANHGNGIVGTGYNDTFIAGLGTDAYEGGGGTVTISGEKSWSDTGGEDIVDYRNATNGITVDLSLTGYQNTGYNTAKFSNIEGIYGTNYADTFTDNSGDNIFNGRGGNDTFNLTHGSAGGKDTLLYELIDANDGTGGNGHDTVNGFTIGTYEATPGADRIDVSKLLIGYTADADGPAHYINGTPTIDAGDNISQYLSVTHQDGNTILSIDRDGAGGAFGSQELITLVGTNTSLEELLANHQIVV
ncbi:Ig-like domain-containing protein [Bartonella sp. LJL80]